MHFGLSGLKERVRVFEYLQEIHKQDKKKHLINILLSHELLLM